MDITQDIKQRDDESVKEYQEALAGAAKNV